MFGTFGTTDVSAPLGDHKYYRCDSVLPLSGRLYLRVLKHVLLIFRFLSSYGLIIAGGSFVAR